MFGSLGPVGPRASDVETMMRTVPGRGRGVGGVKMRIRAGAWAPRPCEETTAYGSLEVR